jgi:hypothetical protein
MQFYVYEIARNRRGLNDWVRTTAQKEAEEEKAKVSLPACGARLQLTR